MTNRNSKWWLALVAFCCLAPAAFAYGGGNGGWGGGNGNPKQVPEGGSSAIYLLGAGLTCLGGMYVRSRAAKPTQS